MIYYSTHFSGCGGSTIGAMSALLKPISAIEFDPRIAELYQTNCGDVLIEDIAKVNFRNLNIPTKKDRNGDILVHQTSPPCQDFSVVNVATNKDSVRANILSATHEFYSLYEPEFIVLENVPGYSKSKVYLDFEAFLIDKGYRLGKGIYNAADYGVPQSRKRFLSIAVADGFDFPAIIPEYGKAINGQINLFRKNWIGWHEAICDLIPHFTESQITPRQKDAVAPYGDSMVLVERIGYRDKPKVKTPLEPCWTIRAALGDDGHNGNRSKIIDIVCGDTCKSLSTHALARIQSFPDSYKWSGKSAVDVRGIGNSIPPLLMQRICQAIKNVI